MLKQELAPRGVGILGLQAGEDVKGCYRFGPMKFESLGLSLSKGLDRRSLNGY